MREETEIRSFKYQDMLVKFYSYTEMKAPCYSSNTPPSPEVCKHIFTYYDAFLNTLLFLALMSTPSATSQDKRQPGTCPSNKQHLNVGDNNISVNFVWVRGGSICLVNLYCFSPNTEMPEGEEQRDTFVTSNLTLLTSRGACLSIQLSSASASPPLTSDTNHPPGVRVKTTLPNERKLWICAAACNHTPLLSYWIHLYFSRGRLCGVVEQGSTHIKPLSVVLQAAKLATWYQLLWTEDHTKNQHAVRGKTRSLFCREATIM